MTYHRTGRITQTIYRYNPHGEFAHLGHKYYPGKTLHVGKFNKLITQMISALDRTSNLLGKTARGAFTALGVLGAALEGIHIGFGMNDMLEGRTAEGLNKVTFGTARAGTTLGGAKLVEAEVIAAGGGTGSLVLAGVAAVGSLLLAEEEMRRAMRGEKTLAREAAEFYHNVQENAVAEGPSTKPWVSWSFNGTATSTGSLTITARVSAAQTGAESDSAGHSRTVIIDLTPPTLIINPPANVTKPAPPYTATITGTATDNASGSGVAAVEWRLGSSGAFQVASGTTNWSASVPLPPTLGSHTVSVRARDVLGNVSPTQSVTVKVIDITGPTLSITTPPAGETFPLSGGVATVEVKGTASDSQTGVSVVEWDLDGQNQFKPVIPKAANDWSTWSVAIPITTASAHTIRIRAKDKATPTNVSKQDRSIVVLLPSIPQDPQAAFGLGRYLDELLNFATQRINTASDGALITRPLLVSTFFQPFDALVASNNRLAAQQPVHQVRLCIEVLRQYFARNNRNTPVNAEISHRQAAYGTLLRHLGTSYDEIRLARAADDTTRAAPADRLGIDATPFRADNLDCLFFSPNRVTEEDLERLFGLAQTALDPHEPLRTLPVPELRAWRQAHLWALWRQQDDAAQSAFRTPVPIIDPDPIAEPDLKAPSPGDTAYDLWKARRQQLADQRAAIKAAREAQATPQAGFERVVTHTLGPMADLVALADEHSAAMGSAHNCRRSSSHCRPSCT